MSTDQINISVSIHGAPKSVSVSPENMGAVTLTFSDFKGGFPSITIFVGAADFATDLHRAIDDVLRGRHRVLREQLAVAVRTIEGLRHIHDSNPSDATADMPALDYARHLLGEVRLTCRDALHEIADTSEEVDAPVEEYPGEVTDPSDSDTNRMIREYHAGLRA